MWPLLERRHSVCHGLLKPNRICRLSETSEPSMEEIHSHDHQFVHGTRNFMETGTVFDKGKSGRPRTSEANIDGVINGAHIEVY